ncbi:MAG: hypothetical protein QXW71_05925 [Thermoplasmata archaeon]
MSQTPTLPDLGTLLTGVFNAIVEAFNAVVNFFSQNAATIIQIVMLVSFIGIAFSIVKKFGRNITNMVRGILPF